MAMLMECRLRDQLSACSLPRCPRVVTVLCGLRPVVRDERRPPSDDPSVPCKDAKDRTVAWPRLWDYLGGALVPDTPATSPTEDPATVLASFRRDFYQCLTTRADTLF